MIISVILRLLKPLEIKKKVKLRLNLINIKLKIYIDVSLPNKVSEESLLPS